MSDKSRVVMLIACALQVLVVAGSIAWVAITGSGESAEPASAENGSQTENATQTDDIDQRRGLPGY